MLSNSKQNKLNENQNDVDMFARFGDVEATDALSLSLSVYRGRGSLRRPE